MKDTTETSPDLPQSKYSPIYNDRGEIAYTGTEVEIIVNDYLQRAEQSISRAQNKRLYVPGHKTEIAELSKDKKFVLSVQEKGEYDWVINIVLARNELDPLLSLRTKVYSITPGGSTIDIMIRHIDQVMRNTQSTYSDRARAKDYIKFIEDMGKKWNPKDATPTPLNVNVGVVNTFDKNEPKNTIDVSPVGGLKKVTHG